MTRCVIGFVIMALLTVAQGPRVRASAEGEYLQAARATARYLLAVARDEGERGLSWPISDVLSSRQTGIDIGAAGIGLFFLELFLTTRDTADLIVAERASAWVFSEYRSRGPNAPGRTTPRPLRTATRWCSVTAHRAPAWRSTTRGA